jgi:hypothetical protein
MLKQFNSIFMAKFLQFISIYWLCALTPCEGQSRNFNETVELKAIPSLTNEFWQVSNIGYSEGWLFIEDQLTENLIKVYDAATGEKVYEFGRKGRGPGELDGVFTIQRWLDPGFIELSDVSNKKNDIYNVECLKQKPPVSRAHTCLENSVPTLASRQALIINSNNVVLNHGATVQGNLFLSRDGQTTDYLVEVPRPVSEKYANPMHAVITMSGKLAANPDRTRFAYFANTFDWVLFFERNGDDLELIHEHEFSYLPEFIVRNNGVITPAENYRAGFSNPVSGKEHYFVLYSGKNAEEAEAEGVLAPHFTHRLKVFDWEGNEVKEIKLDRAISIFTVNHDETKIYGITFNEDFEATVYVGHLKE